MLGSSFQGRFLNEEPVWRSCRFVKALLYYQFLILAQEASTSTVYFALQVTTGLGRGSGVSAYPSVGNDLKNYLQWAISARSFSDREGC